MVVATQSLLWFDYETFGLSPVWDRPAQFACLRTDLALQPIEAPQIFWCRPPVDYLPSPEACLVTGQSPLQLASDGLPEPQFIEQVRAELARPGTCFTGYNNLRFDDEVTRHTLFRNFHDPYAHEWRDGNSRWDLLDVVRLARALRPAGIEWPVNDEGRASNRLEDLARANALEHAHAHDALSDVHATLAVARLLREHQPRLYDYVFSHRSKASLQRALDPVSPRVHLLVSGRVSSVRAHVALVLPVMPHPVNRNAVIVYDLAQHPRCLEGLSAAQIAAQVFRRSAAVEPGAQPELARLPLITLALNKCPVVVPLNTLRPNDAQRLGIDVAAQQAHAKACLEWLDAERRQAIGEALSGGAPAAACDDVEGSLYSGPFFSEADRQRFARLRRATPEELAGLAGQFDDSRCDALLFRYRARHQAHTLDTSERAIWQAQVRSRLSDDEAPWLSWNRFAQALEAGSWTTPAHMSLRDDLQRYAQQIRLALEGSD